MSLPAFTPNTPTFVDEGTSVLPGWALTNCALSQSGSTVRLNQTALGSPGLALHNVTMPVANKDWCLYAKVKCRMNAGDVQIFQIRHGSTARAHVYLNYDTTTNTKELGAVSIRHISTGGAVKSAKCATGIDLENIGIDCALHFDRKNLRLELQLRSADGGLCFTNHCAGSFFGKHVGAMVYEATTPGAWIEWDHLELVAPNIQSAGDSICKGQPGFSPIVAVNETNPATSWQYWCSAYPGLRNNLIVNKGVGGDDSSELLARIQADVTTCLPKVVFLGFCNNDYGAGITYAQRTANIQASINHCIAAGAIVIGIGAVNGAATQGGQPATRDYWQGWRAQEQHKLTGLALIINPMDTLNDGDNYQQASLTSDGLHMNAAGAQAYGQHIAAS